jgi:dUTP pyrophosphatase
MSTSLCIESTHFNFYKDYTNKNGDSGFDIYMPTDGTVPGGSISFKIKLGLSTEMFEGNKPVGFLLLPRSSTGSKTPLRLSNSMGVIDLGYRGELIAVVDNLGKDYSYKKGDRLFQIVPFHGRGVDCVVGDITKTTDRGGGFGSTGV